MEPRYTGRFAPSPTGPLHYGSLAAAVASYLDARHAGGRWLLRIEDLDPPRESPSAPSEIMTQLEAFGLHWDGEVLYQGTRLDAYASALDKLGEMGLTFRCTCSRRQTPAVYPGTCRRLGLQATDAPHAIRFRVPGKTIELDDVVAGRLHWHLPDDVGDFIIRRKDGLIAYQLAVVVDDIFQSVTHIVRGADLLDSTPRQLALYDALGEPPPVYLHLPVMVDGCGEKLSKQRHAPAVPLGNPVPVLRQVLADLGQESPAEADQVDDLLRHAASTWDTSQIPRKEQLEAPLDFIAG